MTSAPRVVRLEDYAVPDWLVDSVHLDFDLHPRETVVSARMEMRRNPEAGGPEIVPLELDGEELEHLSLRIDGREAAPSEYVVDDRRLVLPRPPADRFVLETRVRIDPEGNTALSGLYRTGGNYCTQCEAEGFRRITWWPDRPDVLSRFTVRMEADAEENPVLLSNGNLVGSGPAGDGRHYAVWEDPFRKPSYLFALVAGDLGVREGTFTTMGGREVTLRIWVQKGKEARAGWALESLKAAMRWDEERFGREYDLDEYNIVAVPDFNMGAMENKSLNVFNDKYILADAETATDKDFENIEAIIGHEYFHNWTGNRITCRDWFQLCLKEGLTVFRDQEFTSDLRSRAVKRIEDVRNLRARQFPEDAGPLAHPVRPDRYAAIDNFYTATVYEKGAEVVRMLHTLLGEETFMRAMDIYFARYDGTAATVEDFIGCMEEASGRDLSQFFRWYTQAGTPHLAISQDHDPERGTLRLTITQSIPDTPGQTNKKPHHIPLRIALLDGAGRELPLVTEDGRRLDDGLLEITGRRQSFVFTGVKERPVLSANRGFSAPIRLETGQGLEELLFLMARDRDPFNRWEAAQTVARRLVLDEPHERTQSLSEYAAALATVVRDLRETDPAFLAEMLRLPGVNVLASFLESDVNPQALHDTRNRVLARIAGTLEPLLRETFDMLAVTESWSPSHEQAGRRAARAAALSLLMHADGDAAARLARETWERATNMTERAMAISALSQSASPLREEVLDAFIGRFGDDHLMVDKWLAWHATWPHRDCVERVRALMESDWFSLKNPNRVRSLVGMFASANPVAFARADGAGFALVADTILELDRLNPQVAARLATTFRNWRTYEPVRRERAREALERIAASGRLSGDLGDIVTRTLGTA